MTVLAAPTSSVAEIAAAWPEIEARYPGDVMLVHVALESGAAWIHREATGFAVLSIHTTDFGVRELYVWTVIGRDCGRFTDSLRALARSLGCARATVRVESSALVRLMKKHSWRPKSVELFVEV